MNMQISKISNATSLKEVGSSERTKAGSSYNKAVANGKSQGLVIQKPKLTK